MTELKPYVVWDAGTRWFHWVNALCVMGLMAVGLVILNASGLGVSSAGKIQLKTLHSWIGYVFALNLIWRFVWAFIGNRYARWPAILPGGKGYFQALRSYLAGLVNGQPQRYSGHNPAGRLGVAVLFLLITIQAISGLVLAGTDLFMPPFGHWIAQWVAAPGIAPDALVPYAPELYDEAAYKSMRAFREPFITAHLYTFYLLLVFIAIHVVAVIVTEIREGGGIISAMFTGRKMMSGPPLDQETDGD